MTPEAIGVRPFPWPDGKRCAACVTFDCDADTLLHMADPDTAHRRVAGLSYLQHDIVAVPRIARLLTALGLRQTFFVPAWCIERYPEAFQPVLDGGHEIAHHGYVHESPNQQSQEGERHWLREASRIIEEFAGHRPVGFRAPLADYSEHTTGLLVEGGFLYDATLMHDGFPYLIRCSEGELIELGADLMTMEDWIHYVQLYDLGFMQQPRSPASAAEVFLAEFEAAYAFGGLWITAFHPMVSGRLARLAGVGSMLEYMLDRGDVWFAPLEEIARHVRGVFADGSYSPQIVDMPLYEAGPIPPLREKGPDSALTIKTAPPGWAA
jgi:peptidoglycan-N-acetylglucosamine deacetylase